MGDDESQWRTRAVEDFLRTVYLLQQGSDSVSTMLISRTLHIQASSVSAMIRRLRATQAVSEPSHSHCPPALLLKHRPYHGVRLTKVGEAIALQLIRRRRLLELYLVQVLGYTWDEVEAEADRLEHDLSEQLTQRLSVALGNPEIDPHGEPIPSAEGKLPICPDISLADMAVGQSGIVARVADHSPELLRYFADLGLHPGTALHVVGRSPLGDMVTIQIGTSDRVLSSEAAGHLRLTTDRPSAHKRQTASNSVSVNRSGIKHIQPKQVRTYR